jgi:hypothetical protein
MCVYIYVYNKYGHVLSCVDFLATYSVVFFGHTQDVIHTSVTTRPLVYLSLYV